MSELTSVTAEPSDAALISAVRSGDLDAYGVLFDRHRDAALRLARQLMPGPDADDLVAEAFVRVMTVLQAGRGPDEFFRAYLLTSIRRLHIDRIRAGKHVRTTGDEAELDRTVAFVDPAEMKFEQQAAATAFASLPERWQLVLWHLDVEGQKPAQIAPLLGLSANSVSALAYRAREGLRAAYLQGHLAPPLDESCRWTTAHLSPYVRATLSTRDTAAVKEHLDTCSRCTALYLELVEVNSHLAGLLAPALLGAAAAGYLGTTGLAASAGIVGHVTGWLSKPFKAASGPGPVSATVAAAVAAAAVGVIAFAQVVGDDQPSESTTVVAPTTIGEPAPSAPPRPPSAGPTKRPTPTPTTLTPFVPLPVAPTAGSPGPAPGGTSRPGPRSAAPEPADPDPPAPSTTPTPSTTNTDYGVTLGIVNEAAAFQRTATVTFSTSGDAPDGNVLTATIRFAGTDGSDVYFRGGLPSAWTCDAPGSNQPVTTLTCTRTQVGAAIPPLALSFFGCNPSLTAALTISRNDEGGDERPNTATVRVENYPGAPEDATCQDPSSP